VARKGPESSELPGSNLVGRLRSAAFHARGQSDDKLLQEYRKGGFCKRALDRNLAVSKIAERCFCLFTGHCMTDFPSCEDQTLEECQRSACLGRNALEVTEDAASFRNMKDGEDILTIPVPYFRDLAALKSCRGDAHAFLARLLEAGRRVFVGSRAGGSKPWPEWQCIHMPGKVSVQWLHVHTFTGFVPGESLPSKPPFAVCANATYSAWDSAQHLLNMLHG